MSTPGYTQYGDRVPQAGPAQPYAAQYPGNPTGGPAYPGGIPQLYGGVGTEASKKKIPAAFFFGIATWVAILLIIGVTALMIANSTDESTSAGGCNRYYPDVWDPACRAAPHRLRPGHRRVSEETPDDAQAADHEQDRFLAERRTARHLPPALRPCHDRRYRLSVFTVLMIALMFVKWVTEAS